MLNSLHAPLLTELRSCRGNKPAQFTLLLLRFEGQGWLLAQLKGNKELAGMQRQATLISWIKKPKFFLNPA
ncbi:hypothetical protein ACQE32_01825 [Pantoea sp. FN0302]|uniref:hypothetical protein n=1 Tax=Pantoea sp. FN0302 TaxID=3418558 RepID=UPI003CFB2180